MAKRRGRVSEGAPKASVPAGAIVLAAGAVLVAGVARAARAARGGPRRGGGGRFGGRRKVCGFCVDKIGEVDYKDTPRLRRYISERGKIEPRRKLGTCARHQRSLTIAIKRARHVALLPFTTASR